MFSPDGKKLVYAPVSREFRTWKRTRGGRAQDIWIYDLEAKRSERLTTDHGTVQAEALLDTGSSINVLPFETGLRLGALWAPEAPKLALAGNLARFPAQPLLVDVRIRGFEPVRMAFAWTRSDDAPLIFGQVNFFLEFNVCFFRDAGYFELRPKQ